MKQWQAAHAWLVLAGHRRVDLTPVPECMPIVFMMKQWL